MFDTIKGDNLQQLHGRIWSLIKLESTELLTDMSGKKRVLLWGVHLHLAYK